MTTLQQYLNEVRARQALSYNSNPDVPKLVKMLYLAIEDIQSECYCVPDGRERLCERCSVLKDIEAIAKGPTGDAEMDRFAEALKTTPLKNTENV